MIGGYYMNLTENKHFELHKVKEGIYAAIAKDGGGAVGNAGFIDLGDKTVVFDTFNTQQAALELKKCAEEITNKPVSWVVNSHYHGDHIRGNQVFDSSILISSEVTYKKTRDIQPERINVQKQDIAGLENYIQTLQSEYNETKAQKTLTQIHFLQEILVSLPTLTLTLPSCTYLEAFTIHGTERTAQLFTRGAGHSPCDAFLYLPEDEIIFMGDLLFVQTHPSFFDESDLDNWMHTLQELSTWNIQTAIPGHGPLGTKSDFYQIIQYIKDVKRLAECEEEVDVINIPLLYKGWALKELFVKNLKQLKQLEKNKMEATLHD
jgi:cyclase